MRNRKDIEKETWGSGKDKKVHFLILEALLDIRDLLKDKDAVPEDGFVKYGERPACPESTETIDEADV